VSAVGQNRLPVQKYTSITPKTNFKFFNAFADKDENLELPGSDWDLNFSEQDGKTKVSISIYNESLDVWRELSQWASSKVPRRSSRTWKIYWEN